MLHRQINIIVYLTFLKLKYFFKKILNFSLYLQVLDHVLKKIKNISFKAL